MNLEELRLKIDDVDDKLVELIEDRMDVAAEIAEFKKQSGTPVLNSKREREKLADVVSKTRDDLKGYMKSLYSLMFDLSRSYQKKLIGNNTELYGSIKQAIEETPKVFPANATVACQGVEGAYSQIACERMFKTPSIIYMNNFEGVFNAINKGLCEYGILPIENSTAGSVKQVYDLMVSHSFYIVKTVRVKIDHNLLAKRGTKLSDIKEIVSHEQAINQCSEFLKKLEGVKITCVANTALASKMVAESDRSDLAALSSHNCAELYGLNCIEASVQDKGNNYTRFICISKKPEIYPGADRTSIMAVLPHKPGSLYRVLSRFYTLGIDLIKLESRPIPDRDFEFMFYFDFQTSVYSDEFVQLICELEDVCEEFKYLGSYSEVVR